MNVEYVSLNDTKRQKLVVIKELYDDYITWITPEDEPSVEQLSIVKEILKVQNNEHNKA